MDLARLREAIAAEYKILPYRQYGEKQAAEFWGIDVSTAKRWRRERSVPFIEMPNGGIKYFGFQIIDVLIFGKGAPKGYAEETPDLAGLPADIAPGNTTWPSTQDERFNAENGSCASGKTPPLGTEHDTTQDRAQPSASVSAQLTKLLRKSD